MQGMISFVVGALMILGGFGAVVAASDAHASTAAGTICFVGGVVLMALGRIIQVLAEIRETLRILGDPDFQLPTETADTTLTAKAGQVAGKYLASFVAGTKPPAKKS